MKLDAQITLLREIKEVLNRASREQESNTPDYILAEYLIGCLGVYEVACKSRDAWWGINPGAISHHK